MMTKRGSFGAQPTYRWAPTHVVPDIRRGAYHSAAPAQLVQQVPDPACI